MTQGLRLLDALAEGPEEKNETRKQQWSQKLTDAQSLS